MARTPVRRLSIWWSALLFGEKGREWIQYSAKSEPESAIAFGSNLWRCKHVEVSQDSERNRNFVRLGRCGRRFARTGTAHGANADGTGHRACFQRRTSSSPRRAQPTL